MRAKPNSIEMARTSFIIHLARLTFFIPKALPIITEREVAIPTELNIQYTLLK